MRTSEPIDRRTVAVAMTTDGRRVQLPGAEVEVFPLSLIRSILVGIESLVLIVTGSRRETGGTRRSGRE